MITWLLSNTWVRTAIVIGTAILGGILFILGQRKAGERVGAIREKLKNVEHAAKIEKKMDAVPRPDKPDVVSKLRDGKF